MRFCGLFDRRRFTLPTITATLPTITATLPTITATLPTTMTEQGNELI